MKRSHIAATVGLAVATAAAAWYFFGRQDDAAGSFRFVELSRGDIEYTISATGALSAVRTVQVGTQVSGQVSAIYVNFNDRVRRGQLIARIDTTLLMQEVRDAEAGLARAQAESDRQAFNLRQATSLWESRVITETEFRAAEFDARTAEASLASAKTSLERAHQNLSFASIHSPVDGVVIERNVDVGQTVAASFSAPQLFLIAEDLRRMQILASVAEADIGQITEGLETRFTVQAYPDRVFIGRVDQVRMQSTTEENVVNYTVAVEVENADGALLPGMTATVQFLVSAVRDVLRAPNAALRFRPSEALLAQASRDTSRAPAGSGESRGELWMLDADGRLRSVAVRTGLSDGSFTEVEGTGLTEGQRVVAAVVGSSGTTAANPFQQQSSGPPGGGPPPP